MVLNGAILIAVRFFPLQSRLLKLIHVLWLASQLLLDERPLQSVLITQDCYLIDWFVDTIELVREELSQRGSDWQYIFEMEHLPLLPTKPSLIEGRYPTVGHFEGKMFSSWACEPGCYSTKPVLK